MKTEIISWIKENHDRLLLLVTFLLVGAMAFEAGLLQGKMQELKPLVLSIPAVSEQNSEKKSEAVAGSSNVGMEPVVAKINTNTSCPLVGSKNSDKYHLSTCAVVKRIKPENRVCFSSKEDAEKKGYTAGCIK